MNKGKSNKVFEDKFIREVNTYIFKIDNTIKEFKFNVSIALFYELYNFISRNINSELSLEILKSCSINIMKLMIPFTPHLARECLSLLGCKKPLEWPEIDIKSTSNKIKFAIQVNGKTRDIISVELDTKEDDIKNIILKESKVKKYIENKK